MPINEMSTNPEELKRRLEHDENAWMKYVETANRHHADSLNQLGDLFRLVQGLTQRLDKLEQLIKESK